MTKEEWLKRCAARFQERGGLTHEQSVEVAEACLESQDDPGFVFSELADYSPESCADEDMSNW